MKFFHLSDLHIGKQLYHYNMLAEQSDILDEIVELARREKPQAVLIAGDIYDTSVPSAEAVSVFDKFLTNLNDLKPETTVCVIAGNHDSAKRIDFAGEILRKHRVVIAGMPPALPEDKMKRVNIYDDYGEIVIHLLPFVKPAYVRNLSEAETVTYEDAVKAVLGRETIDTEKRNIILSHQFYTVSGKEPEIRDSEVHMVGGVENVDISVLDRFDYAALGHLHKKQQVGRKTNRYCGTPLSYSVSEAEDEKTVTMVELKEKGSEPVITELLLTPSRRIQKIRGHLDEILNRTAGEVCHDYVSITLTDEVEAYQPKEKLEQVYDHILEIKVDNERTRKMLEFSGEEIKKLTPYEAFAAFFREMNGRELTKEEDEMIREVINGGKETVQ